MSLIIGVALGICGVVLKIVITIAVKLRLLPALLFVLITQFFFSAWAQSIGVWYEVIAIALAAVGLGSLAVKGILKIRRDHQLEKAYVERLKAKCDQAKNDGLIQNGWYQIY